MENRSKNKLKEIYDCLHKCIFWNIAFQNSGWHIEEIDVNWSRERDEVCPGSAVFFKEEYRKGDFIITRHLYQNKDEWIIYYRDVYISGRADTLKAALENSFKEVDRLYSSVVGRRKRQIKKSMKILKNDIDQVIKIYGYLDVEDGDEAKACKLVD